MRKSILVIIICILYLIFIGGQRIVTDEVTYFFGLYISNKTATNIHAIVTLMVIGILFTILTLILKE